MVQIVTGAGRRFWRSFLSGTDFHASGLESSTVPSGVMEPLSATPMPARESGAMSCFARRPRRFISMMLQTFWGEWLFARGVVISSIDLPVKSKSPTIAVFGLISMPMAKQPVGFIVTSTGFGPRFLLLPCVSVINCLDLSLPTM